VIKAEVPSGISYQAVVRGADGELVRSAAVSFKISIQVKAKNVTNDLYVETHSATTNANGLATIVVGRGTPVSGAFSNINWDIDMFSHYLKVETDPTGGTDYTLTGTNQIFSTPYSFLSNEALTVRTETDPVFDASVAKNISSANIDSWSNITLDSAYRKGNVIVADNGPVTIAGTDGLYATGHFNSGSELTIAGSGTRMLWYPRKSSFRAGSVNGPNWDNDSIGSNSAAFGYNTKASGNFASAFGSESKAEGVFSFSAGSSTTASGPFAVAMGSGTNSISTYTTALGYSTTASANAATAFGSFTTASGAYSLASGNYSVASGNFSTALGNYSNAIGMHSLAIGNEASAGGTNSIAMGYSSVADGEYSFAVGYEAVASGFRGISIGRGTDASGENAVAIGSNTLASGDYAVAMGSVTEATLNAALATGYLTKSNGLASTAMGNETTASGDASTALGNLTVASGNASLATGHTTIASGLGSTAMGVLASTNSHIGSFVIGDASTYDDGNSLVENSASNQMMMRFAGGYMLYTDNATSTGVSLAAGGNSWASVSDSTKKENFVPANGEYFLGSLSKLKLGSWNYKGQSPEQYRHYGPMAQEIYRYFGNDGMGTIGNDTTLAAADIDGIVMICLQALEQRTAQLKVKTAELDEANKRITNIEERLVLLEKLYGKMLDPDISALTTEANGN
jgi:hypothetical protein